MEIDYGASNLVEDEAAEVGHNVSVKFDFSELFFIASR